MPINQTARTSTGVQAGVDVGLRSYMLNVYNLMSLGLLVSGLLAMFTVSSAPLIGLVTNPAVTLILFIVLIGLSFMAPKLMLSGNLTTAHVAYWSYCALWGLFLAPIFLIYTSESITRVFFITAGAFAGLSLYGYTTKRNLQPMGSLLAMVSIGLIIAIVVNMFLQSTGFSLLISVIGVVLSAGLTAFKTQAIKDAYYEGDSTIAAKSKSIFGAYLLYGAFITMFIFLLRLFGQTRE